MTASRPPKIAGKHSGRARRGAIKVDEGQRSVGVNNRSGDREATKLRQSPHRPASKRQCFLVGPPAAPAVESMVERIVRGKNLTASTIGVQPMWRATRRPLVYGGIESTNPLYPSKGRKRCLLMGGRGFESISLQQRVRCEPDFRPTRLRDAHLSPLRRCPSGTRSRGESRKGVAPPRARRLP